MLTINLKSRFRNKTFILSMVGAIVLLIQELGFKNLIPTNYADIVNTILTILVMLGIVVDTSTTGISDTIVTGTKNTTDESEPEVVEENTIAEPTIDVAALQIELADTKAKLDSIQALSTPSTVQA